MSSSGEQQIMPKTLTPLRYPGGKTKITPFIQGILAENNLLGGVYAEPFAGGAGIAIKLLLEGMVSRIVINDFDYAIYCFWNSVLNNTEKLCALIFDTKVSVEEWSRQKSIYKNSEKASKLEVGMSTLFLNRCNVSGILTGGIIGGYNQKGNYKIDSRYNKLNIVEKIQNIARHKDQIILTYEDGTHLLNSTYYSSFTNCFLYIDPPYVKQGGSLYKNSFTLYDHINLSKAILNNKTPWILTYDDHPLIQELYGSLRSSRLHMVYSIGKFCKAEELVFFSDNLRSIEYDNENRVYPLQKIN